MPDHAVTPLAHPNRRSVVVVAAWSVPAVALATAAPSYAISGDGGPVCVPVDHTIGFYETSPERLTDDEGNYTGAPTLVVESTPGAIFLDVTAEHPQEQLDYWSEQSRDLNFQCRPLGDASERWATTLHRPVVDLPPARFIGSPREDLPYSTYNFRFSESVTDLRFTLAGLGGGDLGHDVVRVSGGARLDGDLDAQGTMVTFDEEAGEFWGQAPLWGDERQNVPEGQVDVHLPGPLFRFTLEVWRAPYGDTSYRASDQQVFVSDMRLATDCISMPD